MVSFPIVDLRETNRPLFESIMPVVLTLFVLVFSVLFFKKVENGYFKEGIYAEVVWFFISIVFDQVLFLPDNPMQMSLSSYLMDIGLTYVIIILIPIFIGYLLDETLKK
jgi:hypothetical protein